MIKRFLYRNRVKQALKSDGVRVSQAYQIIINNDVIETFDSYQDAVTFIDKYRQGNAIFNLSLFRIEFFSLISDFKN